MLYGYFIYVVYLMSPHFISFKYVFVQMAELKKESTKSITLNGKNVKIIAGLIIPNKSRPLYIYSSTQSEFNIALDHKQSICVLSLKLFSSLTNILFKNI